MPRAGEKKVWQPNWQVSSWMHPAEEGLLLRKEKIRTGWRKPTRHLPIIAGSVDNIMLLRNNENLDSSNKIWYYAGYLVSHKEVSDVEEEI
jgi:hypothetical protein